MRTNYANEHNNTVVGKVLTIIIIRCVSNQSERLACHVTRAYAAFTVCAQLAHLTQAWSAFTTCRMWLTFAKSRVVLNFDLSPFRTARSGQSKTHDAPKCYCPNGSKYHNTTISGSWRFTLMKYFNHKNSNVIS